MFAASARADQQQQFLETTSFPSLPVRRCRSLRANARYLNTDIDSDSDSGNTSSGKDTLEHPIGCYLTVLLSWNCYVISAYARKCGRRTRKVYFHRWRYPFMLTRCRLRPGGGQTTLAWSLEPEWQRGSTSGCHPGEGQYFSQCSSGPASSSP